jgi:DNA-binding GntR family transcriptional regulator
VSLEQVAVGSIRQRQTTSTMVADVLRDAIVRGILKANEPLRQDDLAAHFGLSRIPVREALRQLEGEGLITVRPHRGAIVSPLSADELRELCEIRGALEVATLRRAIPHMTAETLARAEAILLETDRADDVLEIWGANNWRFHATLYEPANRPRFLAMIKSLHDNVDRYLRLHVSILNYKTRGQQEHWQIFEACRRGDEAAAAALLEQHIASVATLLAEYLTDR